MNTEINKLIATAFCVIVVVIFSGPVYPAYAACTVSTTPVNFGNYDILSENPLDTESSVTVKCDQIPPPFAIISIGSSSSSGGFDPRMMRKSEGTDLIRYNLYIDAARTQIWGTGSGNTFSVRRKVPPKNPRTFTVYGRIPPQQNVSAGTYTETLTVTVEW